MYLQKHLLCVAVTNIFILYASATQNDTCESFQCLSSLTQNDCSERKAFLEIDTTVSCCPRCREGLNWNKAGCTESNACSPGLQCINGLCVLNKNTCSYTYHLQHLQRLPNCQSDGRFAAKQCKGDKVSGRCFCYSENGKRIFGWDWHKNADTMTCACSRHRYKLESEGKVSTLHCMTNGNYEPLQCDSGVCWCADGKTGQIVDGTRAVPQTLWTKLPCYNAKEMGSEYLRQCESMAYAQSLLQEKLARHGTLNVSIVKTQCDFDGSYGTYSVNNNIASCTWRDGKTIVPYAANANEVSQMNCNCARDHLHFEESSLKMPLICNGNGNYAPIQTLNGDLFCVDQDGFSVSDFLSEKIVDCKPYLYNECDEFRECFQSLNQNVTTTSSILLIGV